MASSGTERTYWGMSGNLQGSGRRYMDLRNLAPFALLKTTAECLVFAPNLLKTQTITIGYGCASTKPFFPYTPTLRIRQMNNFKSVFRMLAVFLLIAFASSTAFAQRLDGTLRGEVKDQQGAVVSDAKVTATNVATGVSATAMTTSAGTYSFPNLIVGTYTVTVEKTGF